MKLIDKASEVTKLIESIHGRGKKLDADIHRCAVSCLHHADQHGDVTLLQKLIEAMPKSARRNAVIGWACAFGKFAPSEDGKSVVYAKEEETDIEQAIAIAPWEFAPEQAFRPFDLDKELDRLMKKAIEAAESGDERHNVDTDKLTAIRRAASGVNA